MTMTLAHRWAAVTGALLATAMLVEGCSSSMNAAGYERGPCLAGGACNAGLICLSGVCVVAPDAGGGNGGGSGAGATGGIGGIGGGAGAAGIGGGGGSGAGCADGTPCADPSLGHHCSFDVQTSATGCGPGLACAFYGNVPQGFCTLPCSDTEPCPPSPPGAVCEPANPQTVTRLCRWPCAAVGDPCPPELTCSEPINWPICR